MILLNLGEDLLHCLLSEWLSLLDLVALDTSMCNHLLREHYNQLLVNSRCGPLIVSAKQCYDMPQESCLPYYYSQWPRRNLKYNFKIAKFREAQMAKKYLVILTWLEKRNILLSSFPIYNLVVDFVDQFQCFLRATRLMDLDLTLTAPNEVWVSNYMLTILSCLQLQEKKLSCLHYKRNKDKRIGTKQLSLKSLRIHLKPTAWLPAIRLTEEIYQKLHNISPHLLSLRLELVTLMSTDCSIFHLQWPHLKQLVLTHVHFENVESLGSLFLHNDWPALEYLCVHDESGFFSNYSIPIVELSRKFSSAYSLGLASLPCLKYLEANVIIATMLMHLNYSKTLKEVHLKSKTFPNLTYQSIYEQRMPIMDSVKIIKISFEFNDKRSFDSCLNYVIDVLECCPKVIGMDIYFIGVFRLLSPTLNHSCLPILLLHLPELKSLHYFISYANRYDDFSEVEIPRNDVSNRRFETMISQFGSNPVLCPQLSELTLTVPKMSTLSDTKYEHKIFESMLSGWLNSPVFTLCTHISHFAVQTSCDLKFQHYTISSQRKCFDHDVKGLESLSCTSPRFGNQLDIFNSVLALKQLQELQYLLPCDLPIDAINGSTPGSTPLMSPLVLVKQFPRMRACTFVVDSISLFKYWGGADRSSIESLSPTELLADLAKYRDLCFQCQRLTLLIESPNCGRFLVFSSFVQWEMALESMIYDCFLSIIYEVQNKSIHIEGVQPQMQIVVIRILHPTAKEFIEEQFSSLGSMKNEILSRCLAVQNRVAEVVENLLFQTETLFVDRIKFNLRVVLLERMSFEFCLTKHFAVRN